MRLRGATIRLIQPAEAPRLQLVQLHARLLDNAPAVRADVVARLVASEHVGHGGRSGEGLQHIARELVREINVEAAQPPGEEQRHIKHRLALRGSAPRKEKGARPRRAARTARTILAAAMRRARCWVRTARRARSKVKRAVICACHVHLCMSMFVWALLFRPGRRHLAPGGGGEIKDIQTPSRATHAPSPVEERAHNAETPHTASRFPAPPLAPPPPRRPRPPPCSARIPCPPLARPRRPHSNSECPPPASWRRPRVYLLTYSVVSK